MYVKVNDIMSTEVITCSPYDTIGEIRDLMHSKGVHAIPIVDCESKPLGMVTSTDLVCSLENKTLVCEVMNVKALTVPQYADIHMAARIMRNHKIHHVIVTHEKEIAGIISSFDLLQLVEDHRFTMKNAPTESTKKGHQK